ncbi:MAG: hypothetical protein AB8B64_00885 [Granulosicoccus sp.]
MKRYLVYLTTVVALSFSGLAFAQCHLDGSMYDEGEVVAGYVCKGGEWEEL